MKKSEKIMLPPWAASTLELLERHGYEAWCVGGCVRDSLLGLSPKDWDVTTNALPEQTKACFQGFQTVDTGLKHGTVTVLLHGQAVEVTTFRADGAYTDHRHPDQVHFSRRLEDDLSRRDFTVNALAYHPRLGLRDGFNGLNDLENRVLRCVGEPRRRFREDALRILRCLRFASVLGFSIEETTGQALLEQRELLREVSWERIRDELEKLLCGSHAAAVLRRYDNVLFTVLPELFPMKNCAQETPYHCFDVWEHTLNVVDRVPQEKILRWAALLHDSGKPEAKFYSPDEIAHFYGHEEKSAEIAGAVLERLRFSNRDAKEILALVRHHGEHPPFSEKRLKRLLGELGKETLFRLFSLAKGDLSAQSAHLYKERIAAIEETEARTRNILAQNECLTLRDLAVNGNDLLALGFSKGPSLGKALRSLLEEVLDNSLPNQREALLERGKELLEKHALQKPRLP